MKTVHKEEMLAHKKSAQLPSLLKTVYQKL